LSKRVRFATIGFSDEDEQHSQKKYKKSEINEKVSKDIANSELIISGPRRSSRRLIEDMPQQHEVSETEV
jgi:hypothetical protein